MKKVLLVLLLVAALLPLRAQEPESVENGILDAVGLIEAGDMGSAAKQLDSLAALAPGNDAVRYYQGICSYSAGNVREAAGHFEAAAALDTANLWYKETLANLYVSTGNADAAARIFSQLKVRKPEKFPDIATRSVLAGAYRMKRDYPSFFSTLAELVRDPEADDEMKYNALLGALGNFDQRTYNALLPQMETLMGVYAEAEPRSIHAHTLRMQMAAALNKGQTVIDECLKLMELQPDDPDAQVTGLAIIGDTQYSMGRKREAFKTYEKALKTDPQECAVLNNYAYYLSLDRRRLAKAEKMSRITIDKEPDNPTYLDTYGWILFLRGKAAEAKPYFKHAMIYGGKDSAVILMHFSMVLDKLGEKDLASYYANLAKSKQEQ